MRTIERLRKLEAREAKFSVARLLRGVFHTAIHLRVVLWLADGCRWGDSAYHESSNVEFVMAIGDFTEFVLWSLMIALVIMGANPLATASAAVTWLVNLTLLCVAEQQRISSPLLVTGALACFSSHLVAVARCVPRRPARDALWVGRAA